MDELHKDLSLEEEAESETTSQERLKELATLNDDLAQIVASNVATPPELLKELAKHESKVVRKAVTSNPNTPTETLLKLGERFPQELLDNPILELLVLEDLKFLEKIPEHTLNTLIQQPKVPKFLLDYAVNHQNMYIRETANMQVVLSGEMIEGWHETVEKTILSYEAAIDSYDAAINKFKLDFHEVVFEYINKYAFPQSKDEVTDDSLEKIIDYSLAFLANFYKFLKFDLFKNKTFRCYVAGNRNLEPILLKQLACDKDGDVRWRIAENPNTPIEILKSFATDPYNNVRRAVAKNPSTPPETLKSLLNNYDRLIFEAVAGNPSTPPEALKSLLNNYNGSIFRAVAENPSTPPEILKSLLHNYNGSIICAVARNPSTPPEALKSLTNDSNESILKAVAENPSTPPEILKSLLNNYNELILKAVAKNPNTPPETLKSLAKDLKRQVNEYITENSNSLSEKEKLRISDYSSGIIENIAANPNTPIEVLQSLANNAHNYIRTTIGSNPNAPVEILEALANSSDAITRRSVAMNRNIPRNLLESLVNDSDTYDGVRDLLARNPNIPSTILKKILKRIPNDSDDSVLESILKNPQCTFEIKEIIFKNFAKSDTPSLKRVALFMSDYAESSVLTENSNSILWLERYAIACNKKTPKDTLEQLALDGNRIVRATAKESLQQYY